MDVNRDVLLLTPGPTPVHPRAQAALAWPARGHMDPDVFAYNARIAADLRQLFGALPDAFACLLSGTGSLAMETGFANLLEPGERALIVSNGVFGERMIEMATRLGAAVTPLRAQPGAPIDPAAVRRAAHAARPKLIAMVHGETSTGVRNPVEAVADVAREVEALFLVDAVTTAGMLPFEMSAWGVDYAFTGSQKCLSAPPGVAPAVFSARAMAAIADRRTPVQSWYGDAMGMRGYWQAGDAGGSYHHTVPVQLHWATGEAIRAALEEGLAERARRVEVVGAAALRALETVGFRAAVPPSYRLETVLAVQLPAGLDDAAVRARLRETYGISVAGGLGATAGLIWRLGLMGEGARLEHYTRLMAALAEVLAAPHLPDVFAEAALVTG